MENSHCMCGDITFLALFHKIYTIGVGVIFSRSCTNSMTQLESPICWEQTAQYENETKSIKYNIVETTPNSEKQFVSKKIP